MVEVEDKKPTSFVDAQRTKLHRVSNFLSNLQESSQIEMESQRKDDAIFDRNVFPKVSEALKEIKLTDPVIADELHNVNNVKSFTAKIMLSNSKHSLSSVFFDVSCHTSQAPCKIVNIIETGSNGVGQGYARVEFQPQSEFKTYLLAPIELHVDGKLFATGNVHQVVDFEELEISAEQRAWDRKAVSREAAGLGSLGYLIKIFFSTRYVDRVERCF